MKGVAFNRLVAFTSTNGRRYIGDAILESGVADLGRARRARVIQGDIFGSCRVTDEEVEIGRLHCPLSRNRIRTVRCLGLNYGKHAHEVRAPIPKNPVLFYKPVTAITGPYNPIKVHPVAFGDGLDYECEMVVVIGKEGSDMAESEALDHVLGYTVGNDVSHRVWQMQRGGGQWSLGKGFDTWAPIGPGIVSTNIIDQPQNLAISTKVNGKTVQQSNTKDMIFSIAKTISFLSQGCTLLPGDLIFTGTPEGVGMGRTPPLFLHDGDTVEISLEKVGTICNRIEHTQPISKL